MISTQSLETTSASLAASLLTTPPLRSLGAELISAATSRASVASRPGTLLLLLCDLGLDLFPRLQLLFSQHLFDGRSDRDHEQGLFACSLSQGRGCGRNGFSVFVHDRLTQGLVCLSKDLVGCLHSFLFALEDLLGQVLLLFREIELTQDMSNVHGTRSLRAASPGLGLCLGATHLLHASAARPLRPALLTVRTHLALTAACAGSALGHDLTAE